MIINLTKSTPASTEDLSPSEEALLLGSVDCPTLKVNIDTVRLAHGDPTPRENAEGVLTPPTNVEGFRKWPKNWDKWWTENSIPLTVILCNPGS